MPNKPKQRIQSSTLDPFYSLLEGTCGVTGEGFFQNLVQHMAETFQADFAIATQRLHDKDDIVKTLAFYGHGNQVESFEYCLEGTPCKQIYEKGLVHIKVDLQQLFPDDKDLVDMGANSYLGMPMLNKHGDKKGHICVLGSKIVGDYERAHDYLRIFSSRAAAELERIELEKELRHHRDSLGIMIEEKTAELRSAKEFAEQANRTKTEFLARMSHELKTPLNAIYGYSQLIAEQAAGELNPVYRNYSQDIVTASKHLRNLINDLLDFSVLEIGKLKINIVNCQLYECIEEDIKMVRGRADAHGISIRYAEQARQDLNVLADCSRLNEIILNLLTNAIKYNSEEGQISIDIQPTYDNYVRVCITDTGPGLSKIDQAKVFDEFERLSADNDCIEGTGIGLALTRRLVEHMNGRIGLTSKLGRGSTFWFELPVATD